MNNIIYERKIKRKSTDWKEWCDYLLHELTQEFKDSEHGLDLKPSSFTKTEVFNADECIFIRENSKIKAFSFIITRKRPLALYLTLIVSFKKGMGSEMLNHIETSDNYSHNFIFVRATNKSMNFFLKHDYKLFNFFTVYHHVNGKTDNDLTNELKESINPNFILKKLWEKKWIPANSEEFPLLKHRTNLKKTNNRFSTRLQQKII